MGDRLLTCQTAGPHLLVENKLTSCLIKKKYSCLITVFYTNSSIVFIFILNKIIKKFKLFVLLMILSLVMTTFGNVFILSVFSETGFLISIFKIILYQIFIQKTL